MFLNPYYFFKKLNWDKKAYWKKILLVSLKRNKNKNYLMTKTCLASKPLVLKQSNLHMMKQVNSSFLRTENKMHTVSFLRYRGVL